MAEAETAPISAPVATYGEMDFPEERKAELKAAFDKVAKEGRVEHKEAHTLMFTAEERKEYGFGTFEEDLKATNDECYGKGDMAWEDLEKCALLQQKHPPRPRWPAQ